MELKLPISIGDKHGSETDYRDQLLVNYTLISREIKGDQGYILSHPGLTLLGNAVGVDRGGWFNPRQNSHLRVSETTLISLNTNGSYDAIGVIPGSQHVIMDNSFETQGILSDGRFWLYDGATLTEVIDEDLGSPIDFKWINGVYFFTDGENLYHTTATSEFNIDPLTFATSEFSPDRTYGLIKNEQNQMVVLNRYTIEWFRDTGAAVNFRFERIQGKAVKVGIVGTNCKVEMNGQIFILGGRKNEDPSVHIVSGGKNSRIATREIDKLINAYTETELQSVVMETRTQYGDQFIIIRLPDTTLLYNMTIAAKYGNKYGWTIAKTGVVDSSPWRGRNGVFDPRLSKWVYGDSIDNSIGYLDETTAAQYDDQMEGLFYSPIIKLETFSINQMEMDTIPGFHSGPITVFMSQSLNGVTYAQEYKFLESEQFNYDLRFIGRNIGYVRDNFNLKFRVVSTGRTAFGGLEIDYD
jgi:hypothetical protein